MHARHLIPIALAACVVLLACVAPAASAAEGRITLSPARFQPIDVEPGTTYRLRLVASNDTDEAVELRAYAIALEGSRRSGTLAVPAAPGTAAVAATGWVTFPTFGAPRTLQPGTKLSFAARIAVPEDALPGSTALGFAVSQLVRARGTVGDEQPGSRVRLAAGLASTVVLRVPGDVTASARIVTTTTPRLVWGSERARFDVLVENDGTVDTTLTATVDLASRIGGASSSTSDADGAWVLPRGRHSFELSWADRPWLGWFSPTVMVTDADHDIRVEQTLPTVLVLPPWWVLALVIAAAVLPFWIGRRRRRRRRRRVSR